MHVLDQAVLMMKYQKQIKVFEKGMKRHRESVCAVQEVVGLFADVEREEQCGDEVEEGVGLNTEAGRDEGNVEKKEKSREEKRRESIVRLVGLVEREEMIARKGVMEEEENEDERYCFNNGKEKESQQQEIKRLKPVFRLDVFGQQGHTNSEYRRTALDTT